MPAVVVTNFDGNKAARTIPELGHSSSLQWKAGSARITVVTMLREILFSNFYRLLAKAVSKELDTSTEDMQLFVNSPPDPVMIEYLYREAEISRQSNQRLVIHHPGHGLSGVERDGLKSIYHDDIEFIGFGDVRNRKMTSHAPAASESKVGNRLDKEVVSLSVSESSDILEAGICQEHTVELIRTILRPLFEQGMSLVYGGSLPKWEQDGPPWEAPVNFTQTFHDYLLAERSTTIDKADANKPPGGLREPRLFNLSAWPYSTLFDIETEAQWINACSFIRISQADAGIFTEDIIAKPEWDKCKITRQQRLNTARCLSAMRKKACQEIECDIPDYEYYNFSFTTLAHLFIGGKLEGYSGAIPGVWEEILHAFEARRATFIIGAARGAAGKIAQWLLKPSTQKPREFDFEYLMQLSNDKKAMRQLDEDLKSVAPELAPQAQLDKLWSYINPNSDDSMPDNGLSPKENHVLFESSDFGEIARLVEKGMWTLKAQKSNASS